MHERIPFTAGRLTVASADPSNYLNIILEGDGKFDYKTAFLTPMQARALRDVLNKAYPPVKPEAPKPAPVLAPNAKFIAGTYVTTNSDSASHITHGRWYKVTKSSSLYVYFTDDAGRRRQRPVRDYQTVTVDDTNPWHGHRTQGNHIVALFEDGKFHPNAAPVVHTNLASASREAQRLAKTHGKDFAVLRPVITVKAKVIKTVEVEIVEA